MKSLVVLSICLVLSFTVKSQDRSHFKSDIITYEVIDTMWTEIKPLYNDTNSELVVNGIDEGLFMEKMLDVVNDFRKRNGVSEVYQNYEISQDLESVIVQGTPFSFGMSLDYDLYKTIVDPNNFEVGFYFTQNLTDQTYSFMFFIK